MVSPFTSRDSRTASSTWPCSAERLVMSSVAVNWPKIDRTEPLRTSSADVSIWSCWLRSRCAVARTIASEPPTLTTATALTRIVIALRVCAVACTLSWRLRRLSLKWASMMGLTNARDPKATLWPAFSVSASPSLSAFWRNVTMIASSGFATFIPRSSTSITSKARTTTAPTMIAVDRRSVGNIAAGPPASAIIASSPSPAFAIPILARSDRTARSVAAVITGSASMLAESAHSRADAKKRISLRVTERRGPSEGRASASASSAIAPRLTF